MKEQTHPDLKETTVTCICGAEYKVKSAKGDLRVEICSSCHPFYSGKTRKFSSGGRIEKFNRKYGMKGDGH